VISIIYVVVVVVVLLLFYLLIIFLSPQFCKKVINYLEDGFMGPTGKVIFDRIVLDTAPTGHTLRMLSMPDFLIEFIGKVKSVLNKTSGILGGSSQPTSNDQSKLSKFEKNMEVLDAMIHSPKDTEFVIVTIPTEVAVAETKVRYTIRVYIMLYVILCVCVQFNFILTNLLLFKS
jgi:anion-transporting  ArsA/GET3 family ATPase